MKEQPTHEGHACLFFLHEMKNEMITEGIMTYKLLKKRSPFPFLAAGLAFLLIGIFTPIVRVWDYLFAVVIACAAFFASRLIFKDLEEKIELPPNTGDAQTDQLMAEARTMLASFHGFDEQIEDPVVSAHIVGIEQKCTQILARLQEQTTLYSQLRTFLRYYLPTTHKILEARAAIEKSRENSENAKLVLSRTDRVLPEIEKAFEKQLEALDKHRYMDIQVEMDVLEGMLKADGLSE